MSLMRPNTFRSLAILSFCFAVSCLFTATSIATAQDAAPGVVASLVKKSLALVIVHDGKKTASGTGFCIGSHDGTAYILTNKHVVGSDPKPRVVLVSDRDSELYGRIDRLSALDAAVIAVDNASCTPLSLSTDRPTVGTPIGIAGFPAFQIAIAGDATSAEPSFHAGSVSALPANGAYIEYDAQTDHGNSGSPLFDSRTGVVLGLVTLVNTGTTGALQNNLSISIESLASFLSNSHAKVVLTSPSSPQNSPTAIVAPSVTTVASAIDSRCGAGIASGLLTALNRASSELNANDYVSSVKDDRLVIQAAGQCASQFYCPGSSCDDPKYTLMMGTQLLAQQNLRISTYRSNGDAVNALRNELDTTTSLCALPNIMNSGQPYSAVRGTMIISLKLSLELRATGPYRGIVDAQRVRDCASKLGVK